MIRVAAVGDLHVDGDGGDRWRSALARVSDDADLLLVAGDLTCLGTTEEADTVAAVLSTVAVPVFAVLGNHDHHDGAEKDVQEILQRGGVSVLEGSSATVAIRGTRVGIAGTKGFGGGFAGACCSEFGESQMKAFIRHARELSHDLRLALASLDADLRIALLHYAPVPETLLGERLELYPFLGSHLLADAVDASGADLVLHGHAHGGSEAGTTPGGARVRNVAQPVIRSAYRVFCFDGPDEVPCGDGDGAPEPGARRRGPDPRRSP